MITQRPTGLDQFLSPIPTVREEIKFTGNGQAQTLKDFLAKEILVWKRPHPFVFFMIKRGPEGQKKVLIEQSGEHPLVAKDIGDVLGVIFIPGASGNLLAGLLHEGVIQEQKDDGAGLNIESLEESF